MAQFNKFLENVIEIAWVDDHLQRTEKYREDVDSTDEKIAIVELAEQFEKENENVEWGDDKFYYEEIEQFATKELLKRFGERKTYRYQLYIEVEASSEEEAMEKVKNGDCPTKIEHIDIKLNERR